MFMDATSFKQDLCPWGPQMNSTLFDRTILFEDNQELLDQLNQQPGVMEAIQSGVKDMFRSSGCPNTGDPVKGDKIQPLCSAVCP